MVVAVLANRFAPSSRGLKRAERAEGRPQPGGGRRRTRFGAPAATIRVRPVDTNANCYYPFPPLSSEEQKKNTRNNNTSAAAATTAHQPHPKDNDNDDPRIHEQEGDGIFVIQNNNDPHHYQHQFLDPSPPWQHRRVTQFSAATGHRRKPFRAMACLTSLASDLDVIFDWIFFYDVSQRDGAYRHEWQEQHTIDDESGVQQEQDQQFAEDDSLPYLIPPILIRFVLISCILGTVMWFILATDGRVAAPLLRWLGIDKLSLGVILFLCVILEDIPQVILTFLIEDYYEEDYLSTFAVCNVMASLYDGLIKIAEAIDERNDLVETGVWCKHSMEAAHSDTITAVVTLEQPLPNITTPHHPEYDNWEQRHSSVYKRGTPMPLSSLGTVPLVRFLTASLDGTIVLWDSRNRYESTSTTPHLTATSLALPESVHCIRRFTSHDSSGVNCLALLGQPYDSDASIKSHASNSDNSHFLSGCQNGKVRLWNIDSEECERCFVGSACPVACIAVVKAGTVFATGHQDGTTRVWNAWSGACLALYRGHRGSIRSMCAMGDGAQFVTGSDDGTCRLWRWLSDHPTHLPAVAALSINSYNTSNTADLLAPSLELANLSLEPAVPMIEMGSCHEIFQGHSDAILSVACMECGTMFVSGSLDRTARLWSVETGACMQIFSGHSAGVSSVAAIDEVTLLTGSHDTSVKVWDALRGVCLRTYTGHSAVVTGISVTDDDTTFVTTSADRTIKLWVLTALPTDQLPTRAFDQVLDINDGMCRGFDPD